MRTIANELPARAEPSSGRKNHVQPGTANNVDAILGQEMKAGLVVSGHKLLPGPLCDEEPNREIAMAGAFRG